MNIKYFVVFSWRVSSDPVGVYRMDNICLSGSNQLTMSIITGFQDYIAGHLEPKPSYVIVTNIIPLNEPGSNWWDKD